MIPTGTSIGKYALLIASPGKHTYRKTSLGMGLAKISPSGYAFGDFFASPIPRDDKCDISLFFVQ